jgi:hypothetical protein
LLSVADSVAVACARQLGVIEEFRVCYFIVTPRRRRRRRREAAAGVTGGWFEGFLFGSLWRGAIGIGIVEGGGRELWRRSVYDGIAISV